MPLSSTQLAVLVEIRRTGSLARAALSLGVTPPAVSQQVARVERELGSPLVTRGARGARLTALGASLADHGERVLAELAAADETAAEVVGAHARRLRVGAFPSAAVALLPDVLAALRLRFPDSELSVTDLPSDGGAALVARGDLDLALTASYQAASYQAASYQAASHQAASHHTGPRRAGVRFEHVHSDPLYLVVPDDHPVAGRRRVSLAELSRETWVSGLAQRPSRAQLDDRAADAGFVPRVAFQTESYDVAQAIVAAGVAIALVPRLALVRRPRTVTTTLAADLTREVYAVLPGRDDEVRLAGELLRAVRRVCSTLDADEDEAELHPG